MVMTTVTPTQILYRGVRKRPRERYGSVITNPTKKVRVWLGPSIQKKKKQEHMIGGEDISRP